MGQEDKTLFVNCGKMDHRSGELELVYAELGKAYYEGRFEDPLPELLPFFDEITRLRKNENQPKEQLGKCPKCGNILKENALFCGNCGAPVK